MPRRPSRPKPSKSPRRTPPLPNSNGSASALKTAPDAEDLDATLQRWGERTRQAALGLLTSLLVARACWPGAYHDEIHSGNGLGWAALVLVAALLAIASAFLSGFARIRAGWTDLAVYTLFMLVPLSARHASEARVAYNLAWEWVAVGLSYALLRHLPRSRSELSALTGVLVATAVALSAYGLYQVAVIHPETQKLYRENPEAALAEAGIPDSPEARKRFEDRLLGSKEATSTFALANSLAGYLVGPLVLAIAVLAGTLSDRSNREGRWLSALLAAPSIALILLILVQTKSRSAWLGLLAGLGVLAWGERRRIPRKVALGLGIGLVLAILALAAAGLATRQLDRQVLTEAPKSLKYRWQYWVGTVGILQEGLNWWVGLGPGNFAGPYLLHKLPEASESISDPHNLFLEVWATAGLPALIALIAALALALRATLGPSRLDPPDPDDSRPGKVTWLVLSGGVGLLVAMALRPELGPFARSLNPFEGDLMRWVVLGSAWVWAILMGLALWSRRPVPASGLAAGVVAISVNLLAAGGIGFAPVSLMLWSFVAIGQNIRTDRPCGRWRTLEGRTPSFILAAFWAALAGTFVGTESPHWQAQAAIAQAEAQQQQAHEAWREAMRHLPPNLPPDEARARAVEPAMPHYIKAAAFYRRATQLDKLASRAWEAWAMLEHEVWLVRGKPIEPQGLVWRRIDSMLKQAATRPRDPDQTAVQALRAQIAADLLAVEGWPDYEQTRLRNDLLDALRRLSRLDPTNATIHARYAEVLADAGHLSEAVRQADRALSLDRITPHRDRKLPAQERSKLQKDRTDWKARSDSTDG
jgi:hypothetical protein